VHQTLDGERGFDHAAEGGRRRIEILLDGNCGAVVELDDDRFGHRFFGIEVVVERTFADTGALQYVGESCFAVT